MIRAIHRHVAQMQNASMDNVLAFPNFKAIRTQDVVLNVFKALSAIVIKLVLIINVKIPVQALVPQMHYAMWSTTYLCVAVQTG